MKFSVKFLGFEGYWAFDPPQQDVGLQLVDKAREELGLPGLDINLIRSSVYCGRTVPLIELSERVARESGLFEDCNLVKIRVEKGFLNQFGVYELDAPRDITNGKIKFVQWQLVLDTDKVIAGWIAAGYPTEWE